MLSKGDAGILLSAIVLSPKIYKLAFEKLDDPIFDPATQFSYDFIWKKYSEISEEAKEPVSLSMLSARLSDGMDELGPEDAEWAEEIQDLFFSIKDHKDDEIKEEYVLDLMQRVANEQAQQSTESLLSSIMQREAPSEVRAKFNEEMGKLIAKKEMRSNGIADSYVNPLSCISEMMIDSRAWPTGVSWFDEVSEGGVRASQLWGFLAPSGGGKTTFAMQTGMNWAKQGPNHHVVLFTYEQPPEGDITARMLCLATGKSVYEFRDKKFEDIKPEIRELALARTEAFAKRVHVFDFSKPGQGFRGLADIEEGLIHAGALKRKEEINTEEVPPTLVFVDWLIPMLQRSMSVSGKTAIGQDLRGEGTKLLDEIKAFKNRYHVTLIINHQLKADAAKASSARKPDLQDSAEWSGFCWMLDNCWGVGNRSDNDIAILAATKARANARSERFLKLDGEYCRFVDVSNDYMVVNGKIVVKTDQPERRQSSNKNKLVSNLQAKVQAKEENKERAVDVTAMSQNFG